MVTPMSEFAFRFRLLALRRARGLDGRRQAGTDRGELGCCR
jgi:hypothetical protein